MTVTIGGLAFDGAMGTPYPAITPAQLATFVTNALAFRWTGSPRTDQGTITAWLDCTHNNAQVRLRELGGFGGTLISVVYPHGTVTDLPLASVTGDWQAQAGTVNGGVLRVTLTFDSSSNRNSGDTEKCDVDVETSSVLCGPWTAQPTWICMESSDGLGTYAGEAEARAVNEIPDISLIGKWVRLKRKSGGAVVWVGVICMASGSGRRDPSSGQGWGTESVYQLAGVAQAFAQIFPPRWIETREGDTARGALPAPAAGTQADVMMPLTYNSTPNKNGNADKVQLDATPGPTVCLHARGKLASGNPWAADQALETTFAQVRAYFTSMPVIYLDAGDKAAFLTYIQEWPTSGKCLLDILSTIVGPDAQRTFRIETTTADSGVSDDAFFTVRIIDLTAAGAEVDLATDTSVDWSATVDGTNEADHWFLDAGRRDYICTITLAKTSQDGTKGWTDAQETTWDAATEAGRNSEVINNVWRRFTIRQNWLGETWNAGELPYNRVITASQETGELSTAASAKPNAPVAWGIDRTIPTGPGNDWAANGGSAYTNKVRKDTPSDGPLVWWYKAGAAPEWEPLHFDLQVTPGDGYAALMIGRDAKDAAFIKKKIEEGYVIVATVDLIHPFTYRASKVESSPPRTDMPRAFLTQLPNDYINRMDTRLDTIVNLNDAGQPILAALNARRDNGEDLAGVRDRFSKWFMSPDGSASWTQQGNTTITPICGHMVSQIKVVKSAGPPVLTGTIVLGGIPVTRRSVSWDRYDPRVTWTISRVTPTFQGAAGGAAIAAGGAPRALARNSQADGFRNA